MYFVKRGDHYHDVSGASFRDLLAGKLPQLPGERATISDWANHLSTIFPEVRLKRFLEMRGADMGSRDHVVALPALWAGIFYDDAALDGAWDLVKGWSEAQRSALRADVPRLALKAEIAGRNVRDVARDVLALARSGLARRSGRDSAGKDETNLSRLSRSHRRTRTAHQRNIGSNDITAPGASISTRYSKKRAFNRRLSARTNPGIPAIRAPSNARASRRSAYPCHSVRSSVLQGARRPRHDPLKPLRNPLPAPISTRICPPIRAQSRCLRSATNSGP